VGSGQGEIKTVKADNIEAHHECRSPEENCGCATKEMGSGESEESQLTSNDKEALTTETGR
jgi:hypothetical protein